MRHCAVTTPSPRHRPLRRRLPCRHYQDEGPRWVTGSQPKPTRKRSLCLLLFTVQLGVFQNWNLKLEGVFVHLGNLAFCIMISSGVNSVMTLIGFAVSTMFIVFVCTLECFKETISHCFQLMITMHSWRFCLSFMVTVLCISLCFGSSSLKKCAETDMQALLKLKDGFIHGRDILSSWKGEDCCKWKGISCNNLTGHVTGLDLRFSNFTTVEDINYLADTMPTLTFYNSPATLGGIDVSGNHLTGEIPQSITELVALGSLNLSGNNLTGTIPSNIGHMQNLEVLDLSRNNLQGRIPESLLNVTFLAYMNLSFNNLSGQIPTGGQLDTFDNDSYAGNIGLCGRPLSNQCPADVIPPSRRIDKNELINFGFFISLGFGYFVGFWGVCGTLIIKSSWRHAYFQFFNNIKDQIFVTVVVFIARMKRRLQIQD